MMMASQAYHLLLNAADEIIANIGKGYEILYQEGKEFFLIVTFNMMSKFCISLLVVGRNSRLDRTPKWKTRISGQCVDHGFC